MSPPLCRLCTYSNLPYAHCEYDMLLTATRQVFTWFIRHHTWQGISLAYYSDKSPCHCGKMVPSEGVKISMKLFCSLPWVWCYDPQLETCHAWAVKSVPTCQIPSWYRGGRICPSYLWVNKDRIKQNKLIGLQRRPRYKFQLHMSWSKKAMWSA